MEWVERLNQSMNYIEEHLTGEIDYEQFGRIAMPAVPPITIKGCSMNLSAVTFSDIGCCERSEQ